jgi:hypothetical protein
MQKDPRQLAAIGLAGLLASAGASRAELTHRYSFTSEANDSVGTAHGTLVGTAVVSGGSVNLDGAAGNYLNLPAGLIAGYTAVTLEAWASISGSGAWSRLFDFGDTNPDTGNGRDYLFVTPRSGPADTRLVISDADPGFNHEELVSAPMTLDDGNPVHVVAVVNDAQRWMALYINGRLAASRSDLTIPLSAVATNFCYVGRSLYAPDAYLPAAIDEFRVHNSALDSGAVAAAFAAGPDTVDYDPGTVTALSLALPDVLAVNATAIPELAGTFSGAGEIPLGTADVDLTSSDPGVLEVQTGGTLLARGPGTATITAELGGRTATATVTVEARPAVLAHRYSFDESDGAIEVVDSVGGANGTVYPAAEGGNEVGLGTGSALFPGGASYLNGPYIDLPDYLISTKTNITVETWVTWRGPANSNWQRVFDFGSSSKGDNPHNDGGGTTSIYLTPRSGGAVARFNAWPGTTPEIILTDAAALPLDEVVHLVGIYAPEYGTSQFWINGILVASGNAPHPLAAWQDVNNWLGISNWNDPPLNGDIHEFRIYEGTLSELEVALRRSAGPDTLPGDPGALQSVALTIPPMLLQGNPVASKAALLATFANTPNVDVSGLSGTSFTSGDTHIVTVAGGGDLLPVAAGTAELVASYRGLMSTSMVSVAAPSALQLIVPTPLRAGGPISNAVLTATYPGTNVTITGFTGVTFASADISIATINPAGGILPLRAGSTTLNAAFAGLDASTALQVEAATGGEAPTLIHRYSFSATPGTTVVEDSARDADGTLINPGTDSDFTGTGRLRLQGGAWDAAVQSGYVNLPNGLISGLPSVTFEAWIRWAGPAESSWQRILDVGRNSATDAGGNPAEDMYLNPGLSYLYLSPRSGANTYRFAIKQGDGPELPVLDAPALPVNVDVHCAVAYDTAAGAVRLYRDGQRVATGPITHPLSVLEDINVYLGRSQWTDPYFAGEFDEVRIYQGALSDADIAATFAAGPDALPDTEPGTGPTLSVTRSDAGVVISWPAAATDFTLESSVRVTGGTWSPVGGVANNSVTVSPSGDATFYRLRK